MALTHSEIYILIYFSGYEDIVLYALLIMSECTPKVSVECVKECKCRTVEATVGVGRCAWEWNDFNAQCWLCRG